MSSSSFLPNDISIKDLSLHIAGGALLALPLTTINPFILFLVFSIWGLLREQAQKNAKGMSFTQNWIKIWNLEKLLEGFAGGVGAAILAWIL